VLIKKYGNRRLYDTERSRYITLEELAEMIRQGNDQDVRVVGAKDGEDLTTATLAQIIMEGRGAARLLPVPILLQLIRMADGALAEFLGKYVSWALDAYLKATKGALSMAPLNPFLAPGGGLARMFGLEPKAPDEPTPPSPPPAAPRDDVAELRRELEELKRSLGKPRVRRRTAAKQHR
jgi:polyhydroxyalkanoate synthesis repressor PhaR